jgi:hypothetical protein
MSRIQPPDIVWGTEVEFHAKDRVSEELALHGENSL